MDKIRWADRVRDGEVLHRVKDERNVLYTIKRRKAKDIGHILYTDFLLKHVIEEEIERRIEGKKSRGRSRKHILYNVKKEIMCQNLK
jgi:hypothetical protein